MKGGTTEAGIKNLQNNNIDKIIFKTYISAYNRAKVLGKKLMIDIEKIAEHTLKKLHKKSWNTLTLDDVIEKKK